MATEGAAGRNAGSARLPLPIYRRGLGETLSYDHTLLFDVVRQYLRQTPCRVLGDLALELRVSRRTIENSVHVAAGKTFRDVRKEILIERVRNILASDPTMSVKELSFAVGFKSASSFSRAIKRACGSCPEEFRSRVVRELH
ncbi:MAG: helix-turn-helix domain-containing protein [Candidatus Acidiferrum sp.]